MQVPHVERSVGTASFLGLASHHCSRSHHFAARHHAKQRVCRARMADRFGDCSGLACVFWRKFLDDALAPSRASYVCRVMVLHCNHCYGDCLACFQQSRRSHWLVQKLFHLCGRSRCSYAVVVRSQCCGILSNDSLSWAHVLLSSQGCRASGFQLQAQHHSLLVVGFHLHLGWATPLALHGASRVGEYVWHAFQPDVMDAIMGWDDQWLANFAGCLEQSDVGSGAQVFCGRHYFLRDGDFRRTFVIDQKRECFVALYGLDDRARPFRCIGLERIHDIWNGVLAVASIVSDQTLEQIDGGLAFLDRNHWNPPLYCPDLCCRHYPRIDVARDGRSRAFAISRLYRNGAIDCSILVGENLGRGALHYWNRHALLECDHDLAQPSQSV